jgi:hypothetical protein
MVANVLSQVPLNIAIRKGLAGNTMEPLITFMSAVNDGSTI